VNVVAPVLHAGRTRPDAIALVEGERVTSYGALVELVRRTSAHLTELGVRRGDRIGLCLKDTTDHIVTMLALAYIGAVVVTLDWRAPPAENARLVAGLGLARLITEPGTRAGGSGDLSEVPALCLDEDWHHAVARAERLAGSSELSHEPFAISATSGSTGTPKFTQMSHVQYYFAVVAMWELMGLAGPHRFLSNLPLYYSGGRNSCLAHLMRGDAVVLYPSLFGPDEYIEVVARHAITTAAVVPSMVRQLLASSGDGPLLPGLTALFCSGAPLYPEEKREAVRRLTAHFHERYGTAETLAISVLRPADFAARPSSVGQSHSLAELEIVDENHAVMPYGGVGQLRIRAPGMGSPLPGTAAEANFRKGWFYPGEVARLDEAGYIFLQGRSSEVIMRSGAKTYPAEVEATLLEHAGILEAAVVGERGPDNEESVIAFVVAKGPLEAVELLAHCRMRLTPHKVPRRFHFLNELPRKTSGKVDKLALSTCLATTSRCA
jgi:acyl-coenzyme A synthetase/AMP-(fatty) acid ligase